MQNNIRGILSDIKSHFGSIKEGENKLGRDEKKENKYLEDLSRVDNPQKSDASEIRAALSTFLEETELANEIAENLIAVEEDEIEVEELFNNHGGGVREEIIGGFEKSEARTEEFAEKFLQEVRTLDREGEKLGEMIQTNGTQREKRKFEEGKEKLSEAEKKAEKVENEGETMASRRSFLSGVASVAAGSWATKNLVEENFYHQELDNKNKKEALAQQTSEQFFEAEKEPGESGDVALGYEIDQTSKGELNFEVEAIAENNSHQTQMVEISILIPSGWAFSGLENVNSSGAGIAVGRYEVEPGERAWLGATIFSVDGDVGDLFEIKSTYWPKGHEDSARSSEMEGRLGK